MTEKITGLENKLMEVSGRIRELREVAGYSQAYMAEQCGISLDEYKSCENGEIDLNFAFLYRCAQAFAVDVTDIIEGASPTLSAYFVTRKDEGQRIQHAHGMIYYNLASRFKNKVAEPLLVHALYDEDAQDKPIELTTHVGQECDIVIEGQLKVQVGSHTEVLNEGDSIYYNSATPHGMIAVGGKDSKFYAFVLNPPGKEFTGGEPVATETPIAVKNAEKSSCHRIYEKFIEVDEDENGTPLAIRFKDDDKFNFAFDVIDELGRTKPDKLALLHLDVEKNERRFTFEDMSRHSSRAANYFKSLGIKKGDRVMLVLRRNYQFWIIMLALNKIGAIAIPAVDMLLEKDYEYRFKAAGISAIVCTSFGAASSYVERVLPECPEVKTKVIVGAPRDGWHNFDEEYMMYRSRFPRTEDSPCGDDLMLMFFTSGTTGYPKIAAHSFKYALGHFITAKYWHCVDPNGLHLAISDTGWAKAMWGKLYGQWLCEGAIFVYDYDRFNAHDLLPLFAKYNITTFCAPPTMYRFFIKEDISKYDLSSIHHANTAGEALNPEVFHQFKKITGLSIMEGFGQTETTLVLGNFVGMTPKIGSMGKPSPLYEVELMDRDGNLTKTGETGEIVIRTKNGVPNGLYKGYYLDDEKTAEAWHDGYYHTGDTAWRDEDG